jgi:hypothetical protein
MSRGERLDALAQLAIPIDLRATRRRELQEREPTTHLRVVGEELVDRREALFDALGVVESVDTDSEPGVGGEVELASNLGARDGHRLCARGQCTGHSMEIGIGPDERAARSLDDGAFLDRCGSRRRRPPSR